MTRSQKFIAENKRALVCGPDYFNPDTELMPLAEFSKAKIKCLFVFGTPSDVKAVSTTKEALNDYVRTHCPDVFVDFAYIPNQSDAKLYEKYNMPLAIGNITHLDPSHFDVVGFSISILSEVVSTPAMMYSFRKCDTPILTTWSERKDLSVNKTPIFFAGGITASCGDIMFGDLGDGRKSFLDFLYLGECDKEKVVFDALLEAKQKDRTVQEYIDTLFVNDFIYQPQAYEVKFNDKNQIISNKKINPKAQDFVRPYMPYELNDDLGIGRSIINANGDGVGVSQVQASLGCSGGSACNFCHEGNYCGPWIEKSHDLYVNQARESKKYSAAYKHKPYSFNALYEDSIVPNGNSFKFIKDIVMEDKPITFFNKQSTIQGILPSIHNRLLSFSLSRGESPLMTPDHRQWVLSEEGLKVVTAKEIKVGDFVPVQLGWNLDKAKKVVRGTKYYFLGLWYGDGSRSGSNATEVWKSTRQFVASHELAIKKICDESDFFKYKNNENRKDNVLSYTYDDDFQEFVKSIFPNYKYGENNLTSLTLQQLLEFIAGVYDSDGSASGSNVKLVLSERSSNVMSLIGTVLNSIGIQYHKYVGSKVFNDKLREFTSFTISGKDSYLNFIKFIGFLEPAKQNKVKENFVLSKCLDRAIPATLGPYIYDEIRKIDNQFHSTAINSAFLHGKQGMLISRFKEVFSNYDVELINMIVSGTSFSQVTDISEMEGEFKCYDILETEFHAYVANSVVTHNCNYVTDYKGLLYKLMQLFPKVTFINMRLEELGRDLDALKIMKLIGSNRISAPMEGISPRIQNNLFNKCLSEESLNNFMMDMVHARLTDIKCGLIFSGYEKDEDYQWICDFVDSFKKKASKELGNFPFRAKATPLVHYQLCVTGETLSPYPGIGLIRNSNLLKGKIAGLNGEVTEIHKPFKAKGFKLNLSRGYFIIGNDVHPVLTNPHHPELSSSFTRIKDLLPGQYVYLKLGTNCFGTTYQTLHGKSVKSSNNSKLTEFSFTLNEELAELLGWYCGDGFIHEGKSRQFGLCFNDEEIDVKDKYFKVLFDLGLNPKEYYDKSSKRAPYKVVVNRTLFANVVKSEFGSRFDGKKVSDLILKSPKSVQCAFIRGCFSADGTRGSYKEGCSIRLSMSNGQFTHDVQVMLANLGIDSSWTESRSGRKNPKYTVSVRRLVLNKFFSEIGFVGHKSENIVYDSVLNQFTVNGFTRVKVKSIEEVGEREFFGLTVSDGVYVTNGIISHNTPMEYLERRSAKKSMLGEHWLSDEWYEKFREHQVFFKVNGFRYSTFLEQSIIDLGRSATKWMWDNIIKQDIIAYSLRSFAKEEIVNELKKLINVDHFFEARDPDHYISLSHRIHIDLMGSYIARARALVRAYKNGNIFDNVPDVRCLKTYEGAKVKCYKSCVKEEPLKIYNDVEMDEQGNLHGEYRELSGCERCKTPDMRKWRLTRSLPETRSSNDIIAFKKLAKAQKVRFVIKRLPEYDVLSPNNTAHTVIAKVLQQSEELLDMYHSIEGHNNFWQCDPDQTYYTSGIQIIDTVWTSTKAIDLIKPLVSNVNSILKTTQILSVQSLFVDEKLRIEDYNVFRFESTLPMELFQTSSLSYKGDIRVKKGEVSELIRDPKLNAPIFISKGKVIGYFVLPLRYNPFSYLQGLMQDKKISTAKLLQTTTISTEMVIRETANICKVCGQESGISSLTTGKQLNFGIKCLPKVLLSRITK